MMVEKELYLLELFISCFSLASLSCISQDASGPGCLMIDKMPCAWGLCGRGHRHRCLSLLSSLGKEVS